MKKITYRLLKRFCCKNGDFRLQFTEPCEVSDEYIAASDCKVLILAEKSACKSVPRNKFIAEGMTYPNVFCVMPIGDKATHVITLKSLSKAVSVFPKIEETVKVLTETEFEKCPSCGGRGELYAYTVFRGKGFKQKCECPVCYGEGKVPVDEDYNPDKVLSPRDFLSYKDVKTGKMTLAEDATVEILEHNFRASYISLIRDYMKYVGERSATILLRPSGLLMFKLSHSYIGLMHTGKDCENVVKCNVSDIPAPQAYGIPDTFSKLKKMKTEEKIKKIADTIHLSRNVLARRIREISTGSTASADSIADDLYRYVMHMGSCGFVQSPVHLLRPKRPAKYAAAKKKPDSKPWRGILKIKRKTCRRH